MAARTTGNMGHSRLKWDRARLVRMQDFKCFYCNSRLTFETATLDHFIPFAVLNKYLGNSVASCLSCNLSKQTTFPTLDQVFKFVVLHIYCSERISPRVWDLVYMYGCMHKLDIRVDRMNMIAGCMHYKARDRYVSVNDVGKLRARIRLAAQQIDSIEVPKP